MVQTRKAQRPQAQRPQAQRPQAQQSRQARCQCDPKCKRIPRPGAYFCEIHERACPRRSPLTGLEPSYRPDFHNKVKGRKEAMNCYAYAVDYQHMPKTPECTLDSCPIPFPQPGRASGYPKWSAVKGKRCPDIMARAMGDIRGSKMGTFAGKCPNGMRKIAFVADEDQDYHVVRQDSNGFWSHKPGSTDVTNRDALARKIYDPSLASWNYPTSGLNYDEFCGYLCMPATQKHRLKRGGKRSQQTRRRGSSPVRP